MINCQYGIYQRVSLVSRTQRSQSITCEEYQTNAIVFGQKGMGSNHSGFQPYLHLVICNQKFLNI